MTSTRGAATRTRADHARPARRALGAAQIARTNAYCAREMMQEE